MRIDRLDLIAFGPFTDLPLDLSGPGVHVVHGPNEAGKSSALAALPALLYGFEHRTRYDFVHDKPALKLGAVLSDGSGAAVEVVRHKRNHHPLTSPDGTPVPESRMATLLNGVTRQDFTSTFALTLTELQQGGQQLLEGRGDLGQALYSARSGQDLRSVLAHLKERQEALYLSSGNAKKPTINELMQRHKTLQKELGAAQTRAEAFEELRRAVERTETAVEELERQYQEAYTEHRHRERLHRVLPLLRDRARLCSQLEELTAQGSFAPPGAEEALRRLEQERKQHEALRGKAERALDHLREQMADLHVDPELPRVSAEAASLAGLLAGIGKSLKEWQDHERNGHEYRAEAVRLWTQVRPGREPGGSGPERVAASMRERVDELAERYPQLRADVDSSRRQREGKAEDTEASQSALAALAEPEDTELLRAVVEQAPAALEESLTRARERAADLATRWEASLSGAGWSRQWDDADQARRALVSAAVPGKGEVSAYRDRLTDHQARLTHADEKRSALTRNQDKRRSELQDLRTRVAPPTEEELREQRRLRDGLWERIRVEGLPGGPAGADEALARDFEAASARADELADRLRNEAEAVNRRLTLEAQLRELDLELVHAEEDLAALVAEGTELEREWEALWPDEALPVPRISETDTVLDRLRDLRDLDEQQQGAANELTAAEHAARTVAEQLRNLLLGAGVDVEPLTVPDADHAVLLPQLRSLARDELHRRDKAAKEYTAALHRVEADERELTRLGRGLREAEAELEEWSRQWGEAAAAAGFAHDASPQAVRADLERLEQAADLWEQANEAQERADRARQEVEEFDQRLEAVFAACGEPLPEEREARERALRELHERAGENAATERELSTLASSAAQEESSLAEARAAMERAEADLAALLEEAGAADTTALREAVERSAQAAQVSRNLEHVEGQLAREGDIDRLEAQTDGLDDTTAEARVRAAEEELGRLDGERAQARDRYTRARSELERVDGSAGAAVLAEQRAAITAEIEEHTAEYMRLALAQEILTAQMEAYQQQNQGPVLQRAQDLFEVLTLGRFTELCPDTDEAGGHILRVKRRNGRLEEVSALSEGTADQLYLALRLASLERYAEAGQTMPFVVDDVFMTFDDERGEAALKVLDGMADRFQVVVFTHHDHLAYLAERVLPGGRAHRHPLPRFEPPQHRAAVTAGGTVGATGGGVVTRNGAAPAASPGERTCRDCGNTFVHAKRGRPPVLCPQCRG
ncbi:AAA family ATPase [Nocardiopsis dassonvillei]|uniref:ATP-binding protein n=1 Tax=Nocardiopsis dassonvillei TaxID=2014 RepID=UPI0034018D4D